MRPLDRSTSSPPDTTTTPCTAAMDGSGTTRPHPLSDPIVTPPEEGEGEKAHDRRVTVRVRLSVVRVRTLTHTSAGGTGVGGVSEREVPQ